MKINIYKVIMRDYENNRTTTQFVFEEDIENFETIIMTHEGGNLISCTIDAPILIGAYTVPDCYQPRIFPTKFETYIAVNFNTGLRGANGMISAEFLVRATSSRSKTLFKKRGDR